MSAMHTQLDLKSEQRASTSANLRAAGEKLFLESAKQELCEQRIQKAFERQSVAGVARRFSKRAGRRLFVILDGAVHSFAEWRFGKSS